MNSEIVLSGFSLFSFSNFTSGCRIHLKEFEIIQQYLKWRTEENFIGEQ